MTSACAEWGQWQTASLIVNEADMKPAVDGVCQGNVKQDAPKIRMIAWLGGGSKYFLFSSLPGEMIQFD